MMNSTQSTLRHLNLCGPDRAAACCVFLLLAAFDVSNVAAGESLIANGGFEEWATFTPSPNLQHPPKVVNDEAPVGFSPEAHAPYERDADPDFPSSVTVSKDTKEKHGGSASVKIVNGADTDIGVISTEIIPVAPNTTYKVKVWYKGDEITPNPGDGIGVAVHVAEGPQDFWSGFTSKQYRPSVQAGTFDWTEYEFEFTTGDATANIRITCQLRRASGTAWFDDFEISTIDQ